MKRKETEDDFDEEWASFMADTIGEEPKKKEAEVDVGPKKPRISVNATIVAAPQIRKVVDTLPPELAAGPMAMPASGVQIPSSSNSKPAETISSSGDKEKLGDGKPHGKAVKAVVREAAGERWVDSTMADWPDNDWRIYVGNVGNDCTDDMLLAAFAPYNISKARVVRDKKSGRAKGFAFLSFINSEDYTKAMQEMQGRYVGARPLRLGRSKWQDRSAGRNKKKGLTHLGL